MFPLTEKCFDSSSRGEDSCEGNWAATKKVIEFISTYFEEVIPLGSDFLIGTSAQIESQVWEEFLDALGQETGSHPWILTQGQNLYLVTFAP